MFNRVLRSTKRWISNNSENALEEAYQRALAIKKIEDEHFQGQKISRTNCNYGETVWSYFQGQLQSNLNAIKLRVGQFKTNKSIYSFINSNRKSAYSNSIKNTTNYEQEVILEKLSFIDQIINKYNLVYRQTVSDKSTLTTTDNSSKIQLQKSSQKPTYSIDNKQTSLESEMETVSDKTSILPRSFLRTLDRIKQEINPESSETEQDVINKFRKSKYKTAISIKFLLILIIVPLLVHNISKITLGQVFIDPYFDQHEQIIFINQNLEEEALVELRTFEDNLRLRSIIGLTASVSSEEKEEKIREKAIELAEDYRNQSSNAVKNVFADILSLIAFGAVVYYSKNELLVLKSFIDEIIYGLSDSAKAFLIILFTDMFVGFHSPHGWEIILESVARHFGLPENRDFNFLFIATFPVILDTVLKYWIFRYLNRISPSSVATYKNMNES